MTQFDAGETKKNRLKKKMKRLYQIAKLENEAFINQEVLLSHFSVVGISLVFSLLLAKYPHGYSSR
jgi:hypothetical protein